MLSGTYRTVCPGSEEVPRVSRYSEDIDGAGFLRDGASSVILHFEWDAQNPSVERLTLQVEDRGPSGPGLSSSDPYTTQRSPFSWELDSATLDTLGEEIIIAAMLPRECEEPGLVEAYADEQTVDVTIEKRFDGPGAG